MAPDFDYGLYFALNEPPEVSPRLRMAGSFTVRLVASTQIQVIIESPDGTLYGPVVYEYVLDGGLAEPGCELEAPERNLYSYGQSVPVEIHYRLPVSLAHPELLLDGAPVPIPVDGFSGSYQTELGPFYGDGKHTVECVLRLPQDKVWLGNNWEFTIDGTAPRITWVTEQYNFDWGTWKNSLRFQAEDKETGIEKVEICRVLHSCTECEGLETCTDLEETEDDHYAFFTALTDETASRVSLFGRAVDRAGNIGLSEEKTVDFSTFSERWQTQSAEPIHLTTENFYDLAHWAGGSIKEVRLLHANGWEPFEGNYNAVPLKNGWNEFAYRRYGRQIWETHGVYHAGLSVNLPAGKSWLVYASSGTSTTGEWQKIYESAAGGEWKRPWFDVPHLLFVEDVDQDGRWGTYDRLYTHPTDSFVDNYGDPTVFLARGEPVAITPIQFESAELPVEKQAVILLGEGVFGESVVFEWRAEHGDYPSLHEIIEPVTFPAMVSVPTTGYCTFFLDAVEAGKGDGVLGRGEARITQSCDADEFIIGKRPAALTVVELPPMEEPPGDGGDTVISQLLYGVAYGTVATGELLYKIPDTLAEDGIIARYPVSAVNIDDAPGTAVFFSRLQYPYLNAELRLWNEGETVPPEFAYALPATACSGCTTTIRVEDSQSDTARALIYVNGEATAISDATGNALVAHKPTYGDVFYAFRQDRLVEKRFVTDAVDAVTLYLPPHGEAIHGTVTDQHGEPVRGAILRWETADYLSETATDEHGWYSLPVSGFSGMVRMAYRWSGNDTVLAKPVTGTTLHFRFPREREEGDPQGMVANAGTPLNLCRDFAPLGLCTRLPNGRLVEEGNYEAEYWSLVTTGSVGGEWWANWEYMSRLFQLPGALPSLNIEHPLILDLPASLRLPGLTQEAWCGQWRQDTSGLLFASSDCWTWIAEDANQRYVLAEISRNKEVPTATGLGFISARVMHGDGSVPADQMIEFSELLLNRKIRLPLVNGAIEGALPYGVYWATSVQANKRLLTGESSNRIKISPLSTPDIILVIP